jgi:hypothetical protein
MASSDHGCTPTYDLRELGTGLDLYARLDRFADRFLEVGLEEVGAAFTRVPEFAARAAVETGRESEPYRRTSRERYLAELAAIVIMGRQNWPSFAARRDVVVILPDCLRIDWDACRREADGDRGTRCTSCNPDCVAGRISDVAEEHGVATYFAERERAAQFGAWRRASPDLALLGVACIWMLAKGMRDAEEAGIPSQGVLLNYSACEHWSAAPATTDAVVERVAQILDARARPAP